MLSLKSLECPQTLFSLCSLFCDHSFLLLRWRKLLYGVEEIHIPDEAQLDDETKLQRDHFVRYHLKKCKQDIVSRQR